MPLNRPVPKTNTSTLNKVLSNDGSTLIWTPSTVFSVFTFSEYTATSDGAQVITLPSPVEGVFDVQYLDPNGGVLPIYQKDISISGGTNLVISANAGLKVGDKINGKAYAGSGIATASLAKPPANFTGPIAPYYIKTDYAGASTHNGPGTGWWSHQGSKGPSSNGNIVISLYNGGSNMRFPNGDGVSYSEYCGYGQIWHMKPLWCKQIACYFPSVPNHHNLKLTVRQSSNPTGIVDQHTIVFNNPSQYKSAGGIDKWTPDHVFVLPGYDSYILEYEMLQTIISTTNEEANFSFHGDYIIS